MPLVFYWEKEELCKYAEEIGAKLRFQKFISVNDGNGEFVYIYRWIIDNRCPFWRNNKCIIHPNKPLSCKIFPLVVRIPSPGILVSSKCRWVRENSEHIAPEKIPSIFDEFSPAVKMLAMLQKFLEIASKNGWEITIFDSQNS